MMTYKALWTNQAIKTADDVVKYLREEWTEKEVTDFLDKIDHIISMIEINPKLFRASVKKPNVHLAIIKRRTLLVYQVRPLKKQVIILLFWNPKRNPKKMKY
jgi:plasmid stabilization system protein ParE